MYALRSRPIRDDLYRIVGVLTVASDLGDRKRLEAAQRDKLFLAAIVSSADDAIVSKDLNGIVTSWNKGAERLFGYSADEMIGKSIEILIHRTCPTKRTRSSAAFGAENVSNITRRRGGTEMDGSWMCR